MAVLTKSFHAKKSDVIRNLDDRPKMSAAALKEQFDTISDDDITTKFNEFIDGLVDGTIILPAAAIPSSAVSGLELNISDSSISSTGALDANFGDAQIPPSITLGDLLQYLRLWYTEIAGKQSLLTPGRGIDIVGNTISAELFEFVPCTNPDGTQNNAPNALRFDDLAALIEDGHQTAVYYYKYTGESDGAEWATMYALFSYSVYHGTCVDFIGFAYNENTHVPEFVLMRYKNINTVGEWAMFDGKPIKRFSLAGVTDSSGEPIVVSGDSFFEDSSGVVKLKDDYSGLNLNAQTLSNFALKKTTGTSYDAPVSLETNGAGAGVNGASGLPVEEFLARLNSWYPSVRDANVSHSGNGNPNAVFSGVATAGAIYVDMLTSQVYVCTSGGDTSSPDAVPTWELLASDVYITDFEQATDETTGEPLAQTKYNRPGLCEAIFDHKHVLVHERVSGTVNDTFYVYRLVNYETIGLGGYAARAYFIHWCVDRANNGRITSANVLWCETTRYSSDEPNNETWYKRSNVPIADLLPVIGSNGATVGMVELPAENGDELVLYGNGVWGEPPSGGVGTSDVSHLTLAQDEEDITINKTEPTCVLRYSARSDKSGDKRLKREWSVAKNGGNYIAVESNWDVPTPSGENVWDEFDIRKYLAVGQNDVTLVVSNFSKEEAQLQWSINVLEYDLGWNLADLENHGETDSLTINFSPAIANVSGTTAKICYEYWPVGESDEPATGYVDNVTSNTSMTITDLERGVYCFVAWLEVWSDGTKIFTTEDAPLRHVGVFLEDNAPIDAPIIATAWDWNEDEIDVEQYSMFSLKYIVVSEPETPGSIEHTVPMRYHVGMEDSEDPSTTTWNENPASVTARASRTITAPNIWSYPVSDVGKIHLKLEADIGETPHQYSTEIVLNSTTGDGNIAPVTDGLVFDFNPTGYAPEGNDSLTLESASDVDFGAGSTATVQLGSTDFTMWFSENFNWTYGGFQHDENHERAFVVKRGTFAKIKDCGLFTNTLLAPGGQSQHGKEIKLVFKTTNSSNYDAANVIKCMRDGESWGLVVNSQTARLQAGDTNACDVYFCEDSKIEMDVDIEGPLELPYGSAVNNGGNTSPRSVALLWLEGVPSAVTRYAPQTDNQNPQWVNSESDIVIGSLECDVWIYRIKLYNRRLQSHEIIKNFIADCGDADERVSRAARNNIYVEGEADHTAKAIELVDIDKLITNNPQLNVLRIYTERVPQDKKPAITCGVELYRGNPDTPIFKAGPDLQNPTTAKYVEMKAQGTSSMTYGEAAFNLDLDFKEAIAPGTGYWRNQGGDAIEHFAMTESDLPVKYFNIKLNIASSENANNVVLADRYNEFQPFETKAKRNGGRDTIKGYPCAVFITNIGDGTLYTYEKTAEGTGMLTSRIAAPGETIFYGCGDMNNSKKNFNVFGQSENDSYQCCIEVLNNNTDAALFKEDITDVAWEGGGNEKPSFEFRFPDIDTTDNKAMVYRAAFDLMQKWVVSTNVENAKNNRSLPQSVTINGTEYTTDSRAYREAKFVSEFERYFSKDSFLYHYLFTERFAMVDNRVKNTFFSFELDPVIAPAPNLMAGMGSSSIDRSYWSEAIELHEPSLDRDDGDEPVDYEEEAMQAYASGYRWNICKNYDDDTAEGTDNQGKFTVKYSLEAMDDSERDSEESGESEGYFAGSTSVLWRNIATLFHSDLVEMYEDPKIKKAWDASSVLKTFNDYQTARPEALVAEDMCVKYLSPYVNYGHGVGDNAFLLQLLGNKTDQRKFFETFRGTYFKSKYIKKVANAGEADVFSYKFVGGDLVEPQATVTAYADCYALIDLEAFGGKKRVKRGDSFNYKFNTTDASQTQVFFYPGSFMSELTDIASSKPDTLMLGGGKRLTKFSAGAGGAYNNINKPTVNAGTPFDSNLLLESIDLRGWSGLTTGLDLSEHSSLKLLDTRRTRIGGVKFAPYAPVETARLNRVTSIEAHHLHKLSDLPPNATDESSGFEIEGTDNLTTLIIEDVPNVKRWLLYAINAWKGGTLNNCSIDCVNITANSGVAIMPEDLVGFLTDGVGAGWVIKGDECYIAHATKGQAEELSALVGNCTVVSVVSGSTAPTLDDSPNKAFKDLTVTIGEVFDGHLVQFYDVDEHNNRLLISTQYVGDGAAATDPQNLSPAWTPRSETHDKYLVQFAGWDNDFTNVTQDIEVTARYTQAARSFIVNFYGSDKNNILQYSAVNTYSVDGTGWHGACVRYTGAEPTKPSDITNANAIWAGWTTSSSNLTDETKLIPSRGYDDIGQYVGEGTSTVNLYPFFLVPDDSLNITTGENMPAEPLTTVYSDDSRTQSRWTLRQLYHVLLNPVNGYNTPGSTAYYNRLSLHDMIVTRLIKPLDNEGHVIATAGNGLVSESNLTFELAGCGDGYYKLYEQGNDDPAYAKWVFLLKNPVNTAISMTTNPGGNNTNIGGWEHVKTGESWAIRDMLEGVYDALPQHWKALIKQVQVKTNNGFTASEQTFWRGNGGAAGGGASQIASTPVATVKGILDNYYNREEVATEAQAAKEADITKLTSLGVLSGTNGSYSREIFSITNDHVFLLSPIDVGTPYSYTGYDQVPQELAQGASQEIYEKEQMSDTPACLPIFIAGASVDGNNSRKRTLFNISNAAYIDWALRSPLVPRSPQESDYTAFMRIGGDAYTASGMIGGPVSGGWSTQYYGNNALHAMFAFCI